MATTRKIVFSRIIAVLFLAVWTASAASCQNNTANGSLPETGVSFKTSDYILQKIFDEAVRLARLNIKDFGRYSVMVEGAGYNAVFLETQPMGGGMYANRDVEIAKNNQLVFMDCQREDGRLPGSVRFKEGQLVSRYLELQGGYLPLEAFDVYFWMGKDQQYLARLYETLEKYDNYLWKTRDSDNNGCLETWCIHDTGEDHCSRFGDSYHSWALDFAPTFNNLKNLSEADSLELCSDFYNRCSGKIKLDSPMPMESMDVMSFSYANRYVLARASEILRNGKSKYWDEKANEVRETIREYLWVTQKYACYDRDRDNKVMDILIHNNLRCMYFGSFSQQMADDFIKHHLINPDEFWTTMPLPSIAANDPAFRNIEENNWGGQPEGLTFQRSIRAMENYGHFAELTMIGNKLLKAIGDSLKFVQQFDPFTGVPSEPSIRNGYGPTLLASLEFISRFHGIHIAQDKISWSCLDDKSNFEYTQKWGNRIYKLESRDGKVYCSANGKKLFSCTKGIRILSDLEGKIMEVVGIETQDKNAAIVYNGKTFSLSVAPNTVYTYEDKFQKTRSIDFCVE
jgi:hypothetical protein